MDASLGGTSTPALVEISVTDDDIEPYEAELKRKYGRWKTVSQWCGALALLAIFTRQISDILRLKIYAVLTSVYFAALFTSGHSLKSVRRKLDVTFSDGGLDVMFAYTGKPARRFAWNSIRKIDDASGLFIIVPKFGKRFVIPKRVFVDNGTAALQLFRSHGVNIKTEVSPASLVHAS